MTFEIPTDLTALDGEGLASALSDAEAAYRALRDRDTATLTPEDLDQIDALVEFITATVPAENEAREAAEAERQARIDAADARMSGDPAEEQPAEEVIAEVPPAEEQESLAAAAAQRRRTPAPMPSHTRTQPVPAAEQADGFLSIVAAAGLDGRESGSALPNMREVAEAFIARSGGFPEGGVSTGSSPVRMQYGVAKIKRDFAGRDGLYVGNPDFVDTQSLLREAGRESRLRDGSLTASGGWCAPSTPDYSLKAMETTDGIIDLPEVGISRGGMSYTPGPNFADIYATAGFRQTEAQAIAGTQKNCVEVDCPDFTEVRLDAVGICVTAPILTRSAYPEVVERWLTGTTVANQHKVAGALISSMRTLLGTAVAPVLTGTPLSWGLLTALELTIEGQRQAYRLSDSESLEVIAPRWLRAAIRADLANRAGVAERSVSNAQITQHFTDRGAVVQFVLNYQELANPTTVAAFPSTVEVMCYPAGTFVKGTKDVISLDTVYDTAGLQGNVYTAAFVEDGVLLAKMQWGGARLSIPVNITGMMGALQIDDSWGSAQVENAGAAAA